VGIIANCHIIIEHGAYQHCNPDQLTFLTSLALTIASCASVGSC
jgi:hypothetical protein